ncbi:hypothetical protein QYH69_27565 [Paraburkholderia sp. SARCC-3016]|uniref:hypothetical protein n=1 Tax=Paraburkholderia sp. SARCC-3016 TaxID=3058611 RepID=UPI00280988BD|nr:hypothetical protein [Paraburkholderia sp. SARCC-3016]MDQ7980998.1 hypothetical protein [Paraburkholderia sp. SARCC-3016]
MIRFQFFGRAWSEPSIPHETAGPYSTSSVLSRAGSAPSVLQNSTPWHVGAGSPRLSHEDLFAQRLGSRVDAPGTGHAGAEKRGDSPAPRASVEYGHAGERRSWLTQQIANWQADIDRASTPDFARQNPHLDPSFLQEWRRSQIRQASRTLEDLANAPGGSGSSSQPYAPGR